MLTKREIPVLIANLIYVPIFTYLALRRNNYEFLLYVVVILVVWGLILWKQRKVKYDLMILWGLTIWGFIHMAGGNVQVGQASDDILYGLTLIPIVDITLSNGEQFIILRYDQFVHVFGFGVATLVCFHLLKPYLRENIERKSTLLFLVVLMGSGFGAMNEMIEFLAVVSMPKTGVGGYTNTMLDICFNSLGGVIAVVWFIKIKPSGEA